MSRDDYLYAAGVIRFLENKLLNPNDVERMVDSPDLDSSFRVFHDTDYFDNVLDVQATDFIKSLDADLAQAKDKIKEMTPDDNLVKFLFMRHDFHNIKLLFKEKYTDKSFTDYYSSLGNENIEKLRLALTGDITNSILPYCQRVIDYVKERVNKEEVTSALIDRWCDRTYFNEYARSAQEFKSSFINGLVSLQIDVANLKIYIRGKRMGFDTTYLLSEIMAGGSLSLDFYIKVVNLSLEEGLERIHFNLGIPMQKVLNNYFKNQSLEQLERDLENMELQYVRQAKYIDYGPELVVAYFMAKKNAIRNVRLIMTGKVNNINSAEIKKFIREIY